jgi:hypothetical protein
MTIDGVGTSPVEQRHAIVEFPSASLSSIDITITDPTLLPGETRYIGRLEIGAVTTLPGVSSDFKIDEVSNSTAILSDSRQAYGYKRVPYTRVSFQFPVLDEAERAGLSAIYEYLDVFIPGFLSFNETCITVDTIYGIIEETGTLSFQFNEAGFYTSSATVSEVY